MFNFGEFPSNHTFNAIEAFNKLKDLNISSKVVSMPCQELFNKQSKDYKENISLSLDSWNNYFYLHTNENAENFKVIKSSHKKPTLFHEVIKPKLNTIIGSPILLKKWM